MKKALTFVFVILVFTLILSYPSLKKEIEKRLGKKVAESLSKEGVKFSKLSLHLFRRAFLIENFKFKREGFLIKSPLVYVKFRVSKHILAECLIFKFPYIELEKENLFTQDKYLEISKKIPFRKISIEKGILHIKTKACNLFAKGVRARFTKKDKIKGVFEAKNIKLIKKGVVLCKTFSLSKLTFSIGEKTGDFSIITEPFFAKGLWNPDEKDLIIDGEFKKRQTSSFIAIPKNSKLKLEIQKNGKEISGCGYLSSLSIFGFTQSPFSFKYRYKDRSFFISTFLYLFSKVYPLKIEGSLGNFSIKFGTEILNFQRERKNLFTYSLSKKTSFGKLDFSGKIKVLKDEIGINGLGKAKKGNVSYKIFLRKVFKNLNLDGKIFSNFFPDGVKIDGKLGENGLNILFHSSYLKVGKSAFKEVKGKILFKKEGDFLLCVNSGSLYRISLSKKKYDDFYNAKIEITGADVGPFLPKIFKEIQTKANAKIDIEFASTDFSERRVKAEFEWLKAKYKDVEFDIKKPFKLDISGKKVKISPTILTFKDGYINFFQTEDALITFQGLLGKSITKRFLRDFSGKLNLSGKLILKGPTKCFFKVSVWGKDLNVSKKESFHLFGDCSFLFDGEITKREAKVTQVSGKMNIRKGYIYLEFNDLVKILKRKTLTKIGLANSNFDVELRSEGEVFLKNRNADLELRGVLLLSGINRRPYIVGGVEVKKGILKIEGKNFRVIHGNCFFCDPNSFYPCINLEATYEDKREKISFLISGRTDNFKIKFLREKK